MWGIGFYWIRGFTVGLEYIEFEGEPEDNETPWKLLIHLHLGIFRITLENFTDDELEEFM